MRCTSRSASNQKRSSIALRKFIDNAKNHLRAFEKLDEVLLSDIMILQDFILTKKLDSRLGEWRERALALERNPTFKDFYQFLETRAIYLENFLADNQQQCSTNLPIH